MKSTSQHKTKSRSPKATGKANTGITTDDNGEPHSEFPGYPLYASEEDIMNKGKRIDIDLNIDSVDSIDTLTDTLKIKSSEIESTEKLTDGKSNLTKDDLEALGPKDLSLDMGDDEELLKHRIHPVDFSGKDIDIPGSELDDASEAIGSEDEENNGYSIGGDRHEDLEEDKS